MRNTSLDSHDAKASLGAGVYGVIDRGEVIKSNAAGVRPQPYVIFSLPRSRTAWLSHFLSYGDWICGHDELRHMRSLDDVKAWLGQPYAGTIETTGSAFWRLLDRLAPGTRVAVIRRPVSEVVDSLMAIPGCSFDRDKMMAMMTRINRKLDQIEARVPGVMSVRFADLEREEVCAALFEHCLPYRHDSARWHGLAGINIQINMPALIRYCEAYRPALAKLEAVARHRSHTELAMRPSPDMGGMTFQSESFDQWLADSEHLLREHHAQIGEEPENWRNKNIPLLRALDELGAMQITTARSNGRMFGYLISLISPSLVTEGMTTASNTAFFADPSCPGLGLKLQRAALASFRERGIGEVFWETNTVGGGNRIASIYRRLGAEEKGSVYRLRLREVA